MLMSELFFESFKSLTNVLRELLTQSAISSGSVQQAVGYFAIYKSQASAAEMHLGAYWNTSPNKGPARYRCLAEIAVTLRWLKYCRTLLPSPRRSAFPVVQCVLHLWFQTAPCSTALPSSGGSRLFWPRWWQPQSCCLCTVTANAEEVLPGIWND